MSDESTKALIKKKVKAHIPKDWLKELRIVYRISLETIYGIKRTGWINLAIITTMAAILTIFGSLFRFTLSLNSFVHELGNVLEISVYVKSDTNTENLAKEIRQLEHVERVKIIPKEKSWSDLKREFEVPNIENPLPDTLHVKVDKPENITAVFTKIKTYNGVEDLNYAQDIAKKMQFFNNVIHTITLVVVILVAILTITIINNTIQLVIQSRKEEIEIMRLMGVSNWYIKIPLIMQGAIYGFLGALISLVPLNAVNNGLINVHKFFMVPAPVLANNTVILVLFIIAVGFGAGGSMLSIKKALTGIGNMAINTQEVLDKIKEIPAMPNVIVKALGIIKDDTSGTKELSEIMAYDQALTSQVLKLVNSAYYGFAQEITSVNKALALLGMTQTKNIIIAVAMKPMLTSQGGRDMWKHSLKCAVAAEALAQRLGIIDPGDAFTVGFLHDIGKILLNIVDTMTYQKVRTAVKNGMDVIDAENDEFETNHCDMGFLLAKKWKLSVLLANCIKYHHDPLSSSMPQVSTLAYLANKISHEEPDVYDEEMVKEQLGIEVSEVMKIREDIEEKANVLFSQLNAG